MTFILVVVGSLTVFAKDASFAPFTRGSSFVVMDVDEYGTDGRKDVRNCLEIYDSTSAHCFTPVICSFSSSRSDRVTHQKTDGRTHPLTGS